MTDNKSTAPTDRMLRLIDALASAGPLTLAELTEMLGFSRTAVWRGLDTLRNAGWIRMREGDNAFMLTRKRVGLLKRAQTGPAESEWIVRAMETWKYRSDLTFSFAVLIRPGLVNIVEGGSGPLPQSLKPLSDILALSCCVKLSAQEQNDHIAQALQHATLEERQSVDRGQVNRQISAIRQQGFAHDERDTFLPLRMPGGRSCAVQLKPVSKALTDSDMQVLASDLSAQLSRTAASD